MENDKNNKNIDENNNSNNSYSGNWLKKAILPKPRFTIEPNELSFPIRTRGGNWRRISGTGSSLTTSPPNNNIHHDNDITDSGKNVGFTVNGYKYEDSITTLDDLIDPRDRLLILNRPQIIPLELEVPSFTNDKNSHHMINHQPRTIHLLNLDNNITEDIIRDHFSRYGMIERINIFEHSDTKESLGLATVRYYDPFAALNALQQFQNSPFLSIPNSSNNNNNSGGGGDNAKVMVSIHLDGSGPSSQNIFSSILSNTISTKPTENLINDLGISEYGNNNLLSDLNNDYSSLDIDNNQQQSSTLGSWMNKYSSSSSLTSNNINGNHQQQQQQHIQYQQQQQQIQFQKQIQFQQQFQVPYYDPNNPTEPLSPVIESYPHFIFGISTTSRKPSIPNTSTPLANTTTTTTSTTIPTKNNTTDTIPIIINPSVQIKYKLSITPKERNIIQDKLFKVFKIYDPTVVYSDDVYYYIDFKTIDSRDRAISSFNNYYLDGFKLILDIKKLDTPLPTTQQQNVILQQQQQQQAFTLDDKLKLLDDDETLLEICKYLVTTELLSIAVKDAQKTIIESCISTTLKSIETNLDNVQKITKDVTIDQNISKTNNFQSSTTSLSKLDVSSLPSFRKAQSNKKKKDKSKKDNIEKRKSKSKRQPITSTAAAATDDDEDESESGESDEEEDEDDDYDQLYGRRRRITGNKRKLSKSSLILASEEEDEISPTATTIPMNIEIDTSSQQSNKSKPSSEKRHKKKLKSNIHKKKLIEDENGSNIDESEDIDNLIDDINNNGNTISATGASGGSISSKLSEVEDNTATELSEHDIDIENDYSGSDKPKKKLQKTKERLIKKTISKPKKSASKLTPSVVSPPLSSTNTTTHVKEEEIEKINNDTESTTILETTVKKLNIHDLNITTSHDTNIDQQLQQLEEYNKATPIRKNKTGCARTEGYVKIVEQKKEKVITTTGARGASASASASVQSDVDLGGGNSNQMSKSARSSRFESRFNDPLSSSSMKIRGKRIKFRKSEIHDWGLFAMEDIPAKEIVIEYIGEVIRQKVADEREKRYVKKGIGSSYLFRIDDDTIIDATFKGNLARFINHCCDPNCIAKILTLGNGQKKIVIYAKKDIQVGEEITYDYKFPLEDIKIPCLCQSPKCRGFLN